MVEFTEKTLMRFWETGNKTGANDILESMRDIIDSLKSSNKAKDEMIDSLMADIEGLKNEILIVKNSARIQELLEIEKNHH